MASTPRQRTKRTLHDASSSASVPETVLWGREVLEAEARAIQQVTARLDGRFEQAVAWLQACTGAVVVTAIGKPGFVAQKLSATLASTGIRSFYLHPADFGMQKAAPGALLGGSATENARIIREVLAGHAGAPRDVVVLNAGAALFVAGEADSIRDGMSRAAAAIDSGAARTTLATLAALSQDAAPAGAAQ